jgi:hypothetical protein
MRIKDELELLRCVAIAAELVEQCEHDIRLIDNDAARYRDKKIYPSYGGLRLHLDSATEKFSSALVVWRTAANKGRQKQRRFYECITPTTARQQQ